MPYMVNDPLSPWKECCVSFWQDAGPRADTIECLKPTREPASQPAIWVLGDSHASHIKNAVKQVVKVLNFAYASATVGDDCGFQTNPLLPQTEMRQKCQIYNDAALEALRGHVQAHDVLIVAHLYWKFYQYDDEDVDWDNPATYFKSAGFFDRMGPVHDLVKERGATLVIMGDNVDFDRSAKTCIHNPSLCDRPIKDFNGRWSAAANIENGLSSFCEPLSNCIYHSMWKYYCDEAAGTCGVQVPGIKTVGFFDQGHFTGPGGFYVWPFLCEFIKGAGLAP